MSSVVEPKRIPSGTGSSRGEPEFVRLALCARATVRGTELVAELGSDDPRDFLAGLAVLRDVAAPRAIEYGQTSLRDLYQGLYGVEAC